jgi:hypothetical protein
MATTLTAAPFPIHFMPSLFAFFALFVVDLPVSGTPHQRLAHNPDESLRVCGDLRIVFRREGQLPVVFLTV